MKRIFLFFVIAGVLISPAVHAACTSPPGSDESFEWDETTHTWTYCDGTTWKNLREIDDSGSGARTRLQIANDTGACTAAKLGRLRYDGTATWEYCNGSAWAPFEQAGCPVKTPTTTGLVAHWKLNEVTGTNLDDETGSYDATYQDTPLRSGGGIAGNSVIVEGTSYATAGIISEINGASAFTLTGWMRRWNTSDIVRLGKGFAAHDKEVGIALWENGKVYVNVSDSAAGFEEGSFTLNDTDWHHYALVFDGSLSGNSNRLKAYVDGSSQLLTFNGTIPATTPSNTDSFQIGRDHGAANTGYIDDVRIYDSALNATEIQEIYDFNNAGCD